MRILRLSFLTFVLTIPAWLTAAATERFDGNWALDIIGQPGHCELGYRVPVRIDGGLVSYKGHMFSAAAVEIAPTGMVAIRLVSGRHVVTGAGALRGHSGSGSWSLRSVGCMGRWHVERQ